MDSINAATLLMSLTSITISIITLIERRRSRRPRVDMNELIRRHRDKEVQDAVRP